MQPRERDYAYAGSFYAYAIWCGLGVLAIIDILKRKMKFSGTAVTAIVAVITLLVPIQMASQTWDDHDRSNRYTCRDFGQNYLMSLQDTSHSEDQSWSNRSSSCCCHRRLRCRLRCRNLSSRRNLRHRAMGFRR